MLSKGSDEAAEAGCTLPLRLKLQLRALHKTIFRMKCRSIDAGLSRARGEGTSKVKRAEKEQVSPSDSPRREGGKGRVQIVGAFAALPFYRQSVAQSTPELNSWFARRTAAKNFYTKGPLTHSVSDKTTTAAAMPTTHLATELGRFDWRT